MGYSINEKVMPEQVGNMLSSDTVKLEDITKQGNPPVLALTTTNFGKVLIPAELLPVEFVPGYKVDVVEYQDGIFLFGDTTTMYIQMGNPAEAYILKSPLEYKKFNHDPVRIAELLAAGINKAATEAKPRGELKEEATAYHTVRAFGLNRVS